jgi:hypothetical protein
MVRALWVVAGVGLIAALPTPAKATAYCEVMTTPDGFVVLRGGPSASARLIARLRAGEFVQLDSTVPPRPRWIKVFYTGADRARMVPGWVKRSLIERECG